MFNESFANQWWIWLMSWSSPSDAPAREYHEVFNTCRTVHKRPGDPARLTAIYVGEPACQPGKRTRPNVVSPLDAGGRAMQRFQRICMLLKIRLVVSAWGC
jgi:hypothetical protein